MAGLEEDLDRISLEIGAGGKTEDAAAVRPLVIITPELDAYYSGDQAAMDYWGTDAESCSQDPKLAAITEFMKRNHYRQTFANEAYVIYE